MQRNPITVAARAKGPLAMLQRGLKIHRRYGITPAKMDRALRLFVQILNRFDCGASFPLSAVTLERNTGSIAQYSGHNIEFAVHGYTHVNYAGFDPDHLLLHLKRAREGFAKAGIAAVGFRSPYLSRTTDLYAGLEKSGFSYASNQPIMWDVLKGSEMAPAARAGYERALDFYAPWHAGTRPALPQFFGNMLEIPVSLPDDEILLDRLGGGASGLVESTWLRILSETYHLGELFTIQLHPERIELCAKALSGILSEARALVPAVWLARMDEVAAWWRARAAAVVEIREAEHGTWQLFAAGPPGTTILTRGVEVLGLAQPWADDYWQAASTTCIVRAARRPVIGLSPSCPPALDSFLRQQGYVCEVSHEYESHTLYLDRLDFGHEDERPLLAKIEKSTAPLVRLGRWPDGARSALCVTGDIDALTIWDYALRAFGK